MGAEIGVIPYPLPMRRYFSFPLERKADGHFMVKVLSDDRGRFTLARLAPGAYRLEVRFPGGRRVEGEPFTVPALAILKKAQKDPKAPPSLELGDLGTQEGLGFSVAAVDTAGQPVAQAAIGATQGAPFSPAYQTFEGSTGADGRGALSGLAADSGVKVTCRAPGFRRWEEDFPTTPTAVRCTLERFAELRGQVIDPDDRPIANATLTIQAAGAATETNRDGKFAIPELEPGTHWYVVAAPGYRAVRRPVKLVAEERHELLPTRLQPADAFAGKVVDGPTGKPVVAAAVTITDPPGAGEATTNEDGEFSVKADADGALTLSIASPDYPLSTFTVAPAERQAAAEPPLFKLFPGGRIHAVVWDEEADAPCLGCWLLLQTPGTARSPSSSLTTDRNGEALSDLLPAGDYNLSRSKVQSSGWGVSVSNHGGGQTVRVRPGATAEVRLGERGAPLEVALLPPPAADWLLRVEAGKAGAVYPQEPDGVFRARRPAENKASLSLVPAQGPGALEVFLAEEVDKPYLRLPLPQTLVRGTVLQGAAAVPLGRVEIVSLTGGKLLARGGTDAEGTFRVAYLPPGSYSLRVDGRALRSFELSQGASLDLGTLEIAAPAR